MWAGMDIAQNAVFLASDESEWTTAQVRALRHAAACVTRPCPHVVVPFVTGCKHHMQVFIVDGGITTFDAPNKGWMADKPPVDPVPMRGKM